MTEVSVQKILRLTQTNVRLPRAGKHRIEFVWESMLQVMGRESDVIPVIMCLATASNKVLTREHIGHAGSMWAISAVWEAINSNFKADLLELAVSSNELGPQLTKYPVSHDGGLQVRDHHSRCHLKPP